MKTSAGSAGLPLWRKLPPALVVFLVALALRLYVLFQAADTPEFAPDQGDMKFYSDWARRIAAGTLTDHQAFYGLPGYAYWLALVYKLIGFQPYFVALLQQGIDALTATLIFTLAPLAFGRDKTEAGSRPVLLTGALAALGWVLFVPAQVYSSVLMPTCYLVAAFWFVVWWILRHRTAPPASRAFFGLGLGMGVMAMMVANILFLIPLVLAGIWLAGRDGGPSPSAASADPGRDGGPSPSVVDHASLPNESRPPGAIDWQTWRTRALASALLLVGVLVGVSPCAYHNYVLAGEPVILSAHSGLNFYLGNNPQANGYPKIPSPLHTDQQGMLRDSITWAERAAGHPLKRVEVSAFWSGLAKQYIREHPLDWLRLLGKKFVNFWSAFQYDDLGVITSFREDGVLLPGPGFGLVAALALPGLVLAAVRRRSARWIIAAVGLHLASLLTVFVTERYRMAVVPGLLLLGAYGVTEICRDLADRRWRAAAVYAATLAAACFLVNRPVGADLLRLDEYNSALTDLEQGRLDRAQKKLEIALAAYPESAETNFALGNLFLAKSDRLQAKRYYRRTLELDPNHDRVLNNLGVLAIQEKRWPLAEAFLRDSLRVDPTDAKTHYLLACARREKGDRAGAEAAIHDALRLQPEQEIFRRFEHDLSDPSASPLAFPPLTAHL